VVETLTKSNRGVPCPFRMQSAVLPPTGRPVVLIYSRGHGLCVQVATRTVVQAIASEPIGRVKELTDTLQLSSYTVQLDEPKSDKIGNLTGAVCYRAERVAGDRRTPVVNPAKAGNGKADDVILRPVLARFNVLAACFSTAVAIIHIDGCYSDAKKHNR